MKLILVLLAAAAPASALTTDARRNPAGANATIQRGLGFLVKDALAWKAEHNCVSCHHGALVIWSMHEAKQRGHTVDEPVLTELTTWVAESGDGKTGVPRFARTKQCGAVSGWRSRHWTRRFRSR
jgi:hypothetical protein